MTHATAGREPSGTSTRREFFGQRGLRARHRGPGLARWTVTAWPRATGGAEAGTRGPADCPACRTSRRRRSASSTCSRRRARRTSTSSTTSRSSSELHGKPVPDVVVRRQAVQHHDRQPAGQAPARARSSRSRSTARAGPGSATSCRTRPTIADDLCFIKSMHTEAINHAPAITFLLDRRPAPRPAELGAWLAYGLGSETDQLPAFVVMTSVSKGTTCGQIFYDFSGAAGFLPSRFQGVKFRGSGDPVLYLSNPDGMSRDHAPRRARRPRPAQRAEARASSATRRSPRGSRSTRWPSGCRPACPS